MTVMLKLIENKFDANKIQFNNENRLNTDGVLNDILSDFDF